MTTFATNGYNMAPTSAPVLPTSTSQSCAASILQVSTCPSNQQGHLESPTLSLHPMTSVSRNTSPVSTGQTCTESDQTNTDVKDAML